MRKRIIALLVTVLLLVNTSAAFALPLGMITEWYFPGEYSHEVTAVDVIDSKLSNAEVNGDSVVIYPDGSATWGFYVPYGTRSVTINHEGAANIKMTSADNDLVYEISLTGENDSTKNRIVFGENVGRNHKLRAYKPGSLNGYYKEWVERKGEKEITITADSKIAITSLVFEKEMLPGPSPHDRLSTNPDYSCADYLSDISDIEMDTITTVFMDTSSNIIVANGGRRYIDNNNIEMIPYEYNGSIYLPINTLSKALGYYHEEDSSLGYAMLRSDSHEFVQLDGKCTVREGLGEVETAPGDAIIYHNGQAMAAVRYFAELAGKTVGYKDGLIVIDNKYTVNEILNEKEYYNYATGKFVDFKKERKEGTTYYVAQTENASDSNAGNILAPFKTISRAAEVAEAGDTVIIGSGIYREEVVPKNSGEANAPITYKAAEGADVTISANDPVGKLIKSDENHKSGYDIYTAGLPESLGLGRDQIFIDNQMMTWAVYPNDPNLIDDGQMSNAWPKKGNIYKIAGDYTTWGSDTLLNQTEPDYWKGAIFLGTYSFNWAYFTGVVKSSEFGYLTMDDAYYDMKWWTGTRLGDNFKEPASQNALNHGCLVGHENAMDMPGEWVRTDKNELRMILPEGADPETTLVEVKTRQRAFDLTGKKFINVEGIKTIGGGVTMKDSEMCMFNNVDMKYISHYTLSADQKSGYIDFPYNRATDNGAPQRGEVGVYISGKDNVFVNSTIDHSAGAALYLSGLYTYVENNVFNDCGYNNSYLSGIHCDTGYWENRTYPRGAFSIYNNTIYNLGRGAIDFCVKDGDDGTLGKDGSKEGSVQHSGSWLPSEIAYNDIHDANLFVEDGGPMYIIGCIMALDEKSSTFHNNYIYWTRDRNVPYQHGIYYDGNSHGLNSYNNVLFSKTMKGVFFADDYKKFVLTTENDSTGWFWNNMSLGYTGVGIEDLEAHHFSEEKEFYAGAMDGSERTILNYNKYKEMDANGEDRGSITYPAKDAKLSDNSMTVDSDGYVSYTDDGQYVLFEDVDFGQSATEMELYLRGDWNWSDDDLHIYIGKTKETAKEYKLSVSLESPELYQTNTHGVMIDETSGKQNVWVEVSNYSSVRIGGISVWTHENPFMLDDYTFFEYAYNADEKVSTNKDFWADSNAGGGPWPLVPQINKTWSGSTVKYNDCIVEEDSSYLAMTAGSAATYAGQYVDIYIDNEEEPICEFQVKNVAWDDLFVPVVVPLNRVLEKGTYDITFKLRGVYITEKTDANGNVTKTENGLSSNFNYFGFLPEVEDPTALYAYQIQAGFYSAEDSVIKEERPFYILRGADIFTSYKRILVNTLNGTTAGYSDVLVPQDSGHLFVNYAAEEGFAGQEVTVRIDDPKSEPVATFTTEETDKYPSGEPKFETVKVDLNKIVPEGTHKVYISFNGDSEYEQTCRLAWFGFAK